MTDPWKRGDLALCVNSGGWFPRNVNVSLPGPKAGEVHQVEAVWMHGFPEGDVETLQFSPWPSDSFASNNFVKVTPGTEASGSEIERERFKHGNPWGVKA